MKNFDDVYSESSSSEKLEIGGNKNSVTPNPTPGSVDGKNGSIILYNDQKRMDANPTNGSAATINWEEIPTIQLHAKYGRLNLGGFGQSGNCNLMDENENETIELRGEYGRITAGGNGVDGKMRVLNKDGYQSIKLDGKNGIVKIGCEGSDGDIKMYNKNGIETIQIDAKNANLNLGGDGADGDINIKDNDGNTTIQIMGQQGDIKFLNADFAEEFEVLPDCLSEASPGTLMRLTNNGMIEPVKSAYDTCVAGVVAGAGGFKPGIVMDSKDTPNRVPLAVIGKVYCKVDARKQPIFTGDLLTSGEKRGFAIKAIDRDKAFGAVIGKALDSISEGTGLIPVLVNLQ